MKWNKLISLFIFVANQNIYIMAIHILQPAFSEHLDLNPLTDSGKELNEALRCIKYHYQPFLDMGFTLEAYNSVLNADYGTHILILQAPENYSLPYEGLDKYMIDDDGQPFSTYRYYEGTLWLFIPFVA